MAAVGFRLPVPARRSSRISDPEWSGLFDHTRGRWKATSSRQERHLVPLWRRENRLPSRLGWVLSKITESEGQRIDIGEEDARLVAATDRQDRAIGLGGAVVGSSADGKQHIQQRPPAGV